MKIQLYDNKGKQILPITTQKAGKLAKQGKVKPLSKNPPKMKLKEDSFGAKISRQVFLLYRKYGEQTVKMTVLVGLIALLVFAGILGFLKHKINSNNEPENLIYPTDPTETQQIITETTKPTTTEPTTTTQPTTERQITTQSTTTQKTTQRTTTRKSTTKETKTTTKRQPQTTTKKPTQKPTTDNGLPSPNPNDDGLITPDPTEEETLPIV